MAVLLGMTYSANRIQVAAIIEPKPRTKPIKSHMRAAFWPKKPLVNPSDLT